MSKEKQSLTIKMQDVKYIPDYREHDCIGKPDYELVHATVAYGKNKSDMDLVRCKTCGQLFSVQTVPLQKGTRIYCHRKNRHVCMGKPEYIDVNASLFRKISCI